MSDICKSRFIGSIIKTITEPSIPIGRGGGQGQTAKKTDGLYPGHFYTFKIGGTAVAPAKQAVTERPLTALRTDAPPQHIGAGFTLFNSYCLGCHGVGNGGGALPDLARSTDGVFKNYEEIVLNGMLASQGMPSFGSYITTEELADIQSFILYSAEQISNKIPPSEMMEALAKMQYLSDTEGPIRKDIR